MRPLSTSPPINSNLLSKALISLFCLTLTTSSLADNRTDGYGIGGSAWDTFSKTSNPQDATAGGVLSTPTITTTKSPANSLNSGKGGGANFEINATTNPIACTSSTSESNPLRAMASSVYFRITSCNPQTLQPTITICTQALSTASTCPDSTPENISTNYPDSWNPSPSNPSMFLNGLSYRWQCTSPSSCTIAIAGTVGMVRTKAELDATPSTPSDIKANQTSAITSPQYAQSTATAQNFSNCTAPVIDPITGDKTWTSCPDAAGTSIQVDTTSKTTPNGNPQCASEFTNECLTYSTQVNSFERTCSVSPEIVTRSQTINTTYTLNNLETTCTSRFRSALDMYYGGDSQSENPNKNCKLIPALANFDHGGELNSQWPHYVNWCGSDPAWQGTTPTADVPDNLMTLTNSCNTSIRAPQYQTSKIDKLQCEAGSFTTCYGTGGDRNEGGNSGSEVICVCSAATLTRTATYKKQEPPTVTTEIVNTSFDETPRGTCRQDVIDATSNSTCQGEWVARSLPADQCSATEWNSYLGATLTRELNETHKAGCGYCTSASVTSVCMTSEQSSSCDTAPANYLAGCTLTSHVPDSYLAGTTGLATSFLDTYSCQQSTQVCTQYKLNPNAPACMSTDIAQGADKLPYQSTDGSQSFSKAMQTMAVAKEVTKEASNSDTPNISIFGGKHLSCQRPRNSLTGALQKNCCKLGIDRPSKGNIVQQGCNQDAAELSASREKGNTHYVGEYCSSKICFLGACTCREYTQSYCSFPSLLPRLVQEQGREQLNGIIAAGQADAQSQTQTFPYYAANGQWSSIFDANGIKTAYWSWPSACQDPSVAATRTLSDSDQAPCSGALSVWVASCIAGQNCGNLPAYPEKDSSTWSMTRVDALTANSLAATSPFSTAQGTCNTSSASCTFTASHIPRNGSGKALITQRLAWTLSTEATDSAAAGTYYTEAQYTSMCLQNFPASQCPPNKPMPDSYKKVPTSSSPRSFPVGPIIFRAPFGINGANQLQWSYSYDNGASWNNLNTPHTLTAPSTYSLLGGNTVVMQGSCNPQTLLCSFTATVASPITTKPWGSPQNPDCSGFTPTQLGVLDFEKMDLGQWTSTLTATMQPKTPDPAIITNNQNINKLYSDQAAGTTSLSSTTSQPFITLTPTEGFGPFTLTVKIPRVYPNTSVPASEQDPVLSASIDWGLCSGFTSVPWNGQLYTASITAPDPKYAWQGCQNGAQEKDFVHNIRVRVQTSKSAEKTFSFTVNNRWGATTGPAPSTIATTPSTNTGTLPGR